MPNAPNPATAPKPPPRILSSFPRSSQHAALYTIRPPAHLRPPQNAAAPTTILRPAAVRRAPDPGPYANLPRHVSVARPREGCCRKFNRFLLALLALSPMPCLLAFCFAHLALWTPQYHRKQFRAIRSLWLGIFFLGVLNHWALMIYFSRNHMDREREVRRRVYWPPFHYAARLAAIEKDKPTYVIRRWAKTSSGYFCTGMFGSVLNLVSSTVLLVPILAVMVLVNPMIIQTGRALIQCWKEIGWDAMRNQLKMDVMGVKGRVSPLVEGASSKVCCQTNEMLNQVKDRFAAVGNWLCPTNSTATSTIMTSAIATATTISTAVGFSSTNRPSTLIPLLLGEIRNDTISFAPMFATQPITILPAQTASSKVQGVKPRIRPKKKYPYRRRNGKKHRKFDRPPYRGLRRRKGYHRAPRTKYKPGVWTIWYPWSHTVWKKGYGIRRHRALWKGTMPALKKVGPNGRGYTPIKKLGPRMITDSRPATMKITPPFAMPNASSSRMNATIAILNATESRVSATGLWNGTGNLMRNRTPFAMPNASLSRINGTIAVLNYTETRLNATLPKIYATGLWNGTGNLTWNRTTFATPNASLSILNAKIPLLNATDKWLNITLPKINATGLWSGAASIMRNITAPTIITSGFWTNLTLPVVNATLPKMNATGLRSGAASSLLNTTVPTTNATRYLWNNATLPVVNVTLPKINTTGLWTGAETILHNLTAPMINATRFWTNASFPVVNVTLPKINATEIWSEVGGMLMNATAMVLNATGLVNGTVVEDGKARLKVKVKVP